MSKVFQDILFASTYDDIGPLPMTKWADEGDIQRRSRYEFPHRDGQDVQAQARSPLVTAGEMVFLAGIEGYPDLWPRTYLLMRKRLREEDNAYFKHPLYGNVWGYFEKFTAQYTTDMLNGCTVAFQFQEVTEQGKRSQVAQNPISGAKEQAAMADAGLAQLQVPPPNLPPPTPGQAVPVFASVGPDVDAFASFLDQEGQTADTIAAQVNAFRGKVNLILQVPDLLDARNVEVRLALVQAAAQVTLAGEQAQASTAAIIAFPVPFTMGPLELAVYLYEDISRAAEIVSLNPSQFFDYPKDFVMRVADL